MTSGSGGPPCLGTGPEWGCPRSVTEGCLLPSDWGPAGAGLRRGPPGGLPPSHPPPFFPGISGPSPSDVTGGCYGNCPKFPNKITAGGLSFLGGSRRVNNGGGRRGRRGAVSPSHSSFCWDQGGVPRARRRVPSPTGSREPTSTRGTGAQTRDSGVTAEMRRGDLRREAGAAGEQRRDLRPALRPLHTLPPAPPTPSRRPVQLWLLPAAWLPTSGGLRAHFLSPWLPGGR